MIPTFTVTKLLSLLLYPLSQALLLCLLAVVLIWRDRRRAALAALLAGAAWLYLCSTGPFADYLMAGLERDYPSRAMSSIEPVDVIVVLGGAMRGDTHMGTLADLNQQADRLVYGAALYRAGKAPLLLLSGGGAAEVRTEAEMMRDIMLVMGVPARAILQESRSRDTHDNAVFSAEILRSKGLGRILLVTSAFHMRRAKALFDAQGLEVVPAPTDFQRLVMGPKLPGWLPGVGNLYRSTYALREYAGYWYYRWQGWL